MCRSIDSLIERIASAKLDKGELMTVLNTSEWSSVCLVIVTLRFEIAWIHDRSFFPSFTSGTKAIHGKCKFCLNLFRGAKDTIHCVSQYSETDSQSKTTDKAQCREQDEFSACSSPSVGRRPKLRVLL